MLTFQTCCADKGYCDSGEYCAPVAGNCCKTGEDLTSCALRAGFVLPVTSSAAVSAAVATPTSSGVLTPFLSGSLPASVPAVSIIPASATPVASAYGNATAAATGYIAGTTTPSVVEVSVAAKEGAATMKLVGAVAVAAMLAICL